MKAKHPDAVLLFRIGNFYETLLDDAIACSEILGITLTRRYNGKEKATELAGFPHHALDTYLPKLVRAGKRVAICEENKQEPIEKVTPNATASEPKTEEPKQEPKPNKTMKTIKRKDTIIEGVKYLEEEPFAWLTLRIPKDAKDCGKSASKEQIRSTMTAIMVEPDNNKMVVSNTRILHAYDVECKGAWPKDRNTPFQFYIEPKDIARLAGQEVDVAVWKAEVNGRKTEIATCEVVGTITECDYKGAYPNWQRIMPQNTPNFVKLTEDAVDALRSWLKPLIGKTKKERENSQILIKANKKTGKLDVCVRVRESAYGEVVAEHAESFAIDDFNSDIMVCFLAELFYYAILPDFDGNIFISNCTANKFCGKMRETILMPMAYQE